MILEARQYFVRGSANFQAYQAMRKAFSSAPRAAAGEEGEPEAAGFPRHRSISCSRAAGLRPRKDF
jgi:hypothetical protein